MTFTIPVWAFWVLGGLAALVVLGLAAVGCIFIWAFRDGIL